MTARDGRVPGFALPLLVCLGALALSVCLYFPGYLSYDSAHQFWQVRHARYSNHQPVAMTALWSALHALWPSPAALLAFHFAMLWTGLLLLALRFWQHNLLRIAFMLAAGFLPPTFVIMGHLWIDASLIAAMTLGFGLTVAGLGRQRPLALALALPVILYAGMVRHNSLPAVIPLAILWALAAIDTADRGRAALAPRRRGIAAAGIAVLVIGASFASGRILDQVLVRDRVSLFALGTLWDLAGMSVRANTMLIPPFARTPGLSLGDLRQLYSPLNNVALYLPKEHVRHGLDEEAYSEEELQAIAGIWLRSIVAHPKAYLGHRWDVTSNLFGQYQRNPAGLFFDPLVIAYEDNPAPEANLSDLKVAFADQVRRHKGWPVFKPALYLLIAVGAAAWAWPRRNSPSGRVALSAAASGLLLALPLAIIAPSVDLRYCGWLFMSSAIGLAACFARIPAVEDGSATQLLGSSVRG